MAGFKTLSIIALAATALMAGLLLVRVGVAVDTPPNRAPGSLRSLSAINTATSLSAASSPASTQRLQQIVDGQNMTNSLLREIRDKVGSGGATAVSNAVAAPAETDVVVAPESGDFMSRVRARKAKLEAEKKKKHSQQSAVSECATGPTHGQLAKDMMFDSETIRFSKVSLFDITNFWESDVPIDLSFMFVNPEDKNTDNILKYLMQHEAHVINMFFHILNTSPCAKEEPISGTPGCWESHPLGKAAIENGDDIVVLDIGSNAGFYTQMVAAMGYKVIAFDPQPHCILFVTGTAAMNGFSTSQVTAINAFVSDTDMESSVMTRTGCWGTFPLVSAHELGATTRLQASVPKSRAKTMVPNVVIDQIIDADSTFIPLVKIDTEGAEHLVFHGLDNLLKKNRILTLVVEANKLTWTKRELSFEFLADMFMKLVSYGYLFKPNNDGNTRTVMPRDWMDRDVMLGWLKEGWIVADLFFYLPSDGQSRHKTSQPPVGTVPVVPAVSPVAAPAVGAPPAAAAAAAAAATVPASAPPSDDILGESPALPVQKVNSRTPAGATPAVRA